MKRVMMFGAVLLWAVMLNPAAGAGEPFLREDFASLDDWEPVTFPKIRKQSDYTVRTTGTGSILVATSDASASGIRWKKEFDVYKYPFVRWRWKIDNVYRSGDLEQRSGDDYPIRVYIMFKYEPDQASFAEMVAYGLAKIVYGAYPPHSSLNYIWANRQHAKSVYPSTYTDQARLIILRTGSAEAGKWLDEEVNIVEDYYRAFGEKPPATASIAVMNDSDNTGESSSSYIDYITVGEKE